MPVYKLTLQFIKIHGKLWLSQINDAVDYFRKIREIIINPVTYVWLIEVDLDLIVIAFLNVSMTVNFVQRRKMEYSTAT